MVAKLRLLAALGALVTALVVGWQSAPPASIGTPNVQLRSTAAPMDPPTTMKSPIVATTDPSPFNPCQDIPFDAVQRLGLAFTPPEPQEGLRCQYDAVETTVNGHRAAQWWNLKPTYHNSYWFFSCMVAFKTSYGVIQQSLFYSTVYSSPEVDCPSTNLQRANELSPYYKF